MPWPDAYSERRNGGFRVWRCGGPSVRLVPRETGDKASEFEGRTTTVFSRRPSGSGLMELSTKRDCDRRNDRVNQTSDLVRRCILVRLDASNTMSDGRQQELHQTGGNDLAPDLEQLEFNVLGEGHETNDVNVTYIAAG
jgi:hypothetical protein